MPQNITKDEINAYNLQLQLVFDVARNKMYSHELRLSGRKCIFFFDKQNMQLLFLQLRCVSKWTIIIYCFENSFHYFRIFRNVPSLQKILSETCEKRSRNGISRELLSLLAQVAISYFSLVAKITME